MVNIKDIGELLGTATVAGGVNEEAIQEAEAELGIRFPPSYRRFLSHFGAAFGSGYEIAGLFEADNDDDRPPLWVNVVTSTLELRSDSHGEFPNEYIPFSGDGGDYEFYLDMSRSNAQGESPVIALDRGGHAVIIADDFLDFVRRSCDGSLSF